MTLEELRKVVHTSPFQPFTIYLADSTSVRIPHPDFIAIPSVGRTVVVYREGERAHSVMDLLLATKLEVGGSAQNAN